MLSAVLVSLLYQEWSDAARITASAAITVAIGVALWRGFDRPGELTVREGFAAQAAADPSRFATLTGWRPEIPLGQTLADLLDWWKARLAENR